MNGTHITDHRLAVVTGHRALRDAEANGERTYVAVWADGTVVRFAVPSAEHARVYAREYGIRHNVDAGRAPVSVIWDR